MKCPNCSFVNSDDIRNCKVCGYELDVIPKAKKRVIDASEEEALDSALKSLFGLDAKKQIEEEDPLDVAAVERMLKKKRPVQSTVITETTSSIDSIDGETIDDEDVETPPFDSDEPEEKQNRKLPIIIIASALVVLLLIFFSSNLSHKLWKYNSDDSTNENNSVGSSEAITTEETTEATFSLGDAEALEPVNTFFNTLPAFVNQGNLNILSLFSNSQDALDVLTSFAVIGNVEKIASGSIEASEVTEENATYTVNTTIDRLIEGQQKKVPILWDFRLVKVDSIWKIQSFSIDSETLTIATSNAENTETTTESKPESTTAASTEATTVTTTETTTEATTEAKLEGFTSSGGFSGGTSATGQDIASARYGNHQSFERIVFDIYEWIGGQPTTPVDNIGAYAAIISEDGKTIRININGALDAYADNLTLDLKGSANIQSVQYANSGNGEMVTIVIHLAKPSQYKVFSLKLPAKLVVDIATFE